MFLEDLHVYVLCSVMLCIYVHVLVTSRAHGLLVNLQVTAWCWWSQHVGRSFGPFVWNEGRRIVLLGEVSEVLWVHMSHMV